MFRFLTIALLAGAAFPAIAVAQDSDRARGDRPRAERPARADNGPRPDRQGFQPRQQRDDSARFDRQQRSFTPPAAPAQAAPAPQARPDRADWRGGGRDGRADDGRRGWRNDAPVPPAAVAQPQPAPDTRGRDQRRNWNGNQNGNNDARRDWNRNNNRQDWNRNNAGRDWNRNDGRRDWNDNRRVDNNRRWDGNRNTTRNWNRDWRNDRRYDWQGYRASNRYAYRLPQYYAPRGWDYGYRRFGIGTTLFAGLFAQDYWIGDPYNYRLPPVDWPYRWVRYYDDALLVDTTTGQVVDEIPGLFW